MAPRLTGVRFLGELSLKSAYGNYNSAPASARTQRLITTKPRVLRPPARAMPRVGRNQRSEDQPSVAASHGSENCNNGKRQQYPVRPMQPCEGTLWLRMRPNVEPSMKNEWFGNEQDEREQQPDADHRVHPPKLRRDEPIP